MRPTNELNWDKAAQPVQLPLLNSTENTYDSNRAGSITQKIILRASREPKIRTVKSVAKKIKGKVNAPHVVCMLNMLKGN